MAVTIPVWKKAPFIRFLLPLTIGIILQWNFQWGPKILWGVFTFSILLLSFSFLLTSYRRYKLAVMNGASVFIIFLSLGSLLTWYADIRHRANSYGNHYKHGDEVVAILQEPIVKKSNSYKALATVKAIGRNGEFIATRGDVIIYFQKDADVSSLDYSSEIIFSSPLQEVKNAGNPGGFDYKRYCLFQGITHQAFLKKGGFIVLDKKKQSISGRILFAIRKKVLSVLQANIPGEKERGLAEALLIGYKDDLDKNLVQSYSNTGVVHIIAISGLHLGLIYWLLVQVLKPFRRKRISKWLNPIIIISGLWLFSLVAGGQPSVLRSALMFSCIVLAESLSRKTSIYNTLAFSAFILLCINPYWLWDVGFQLSYVAVLSIVIFMKPIYNLFFIKNKILDFIWKLNAVSIAAQLLTTPFSIYHFHQFPNFFLLTNFVAVPLSGVIVLGEIFLCAVSFIPFLASLAGKIISWLIWVMNSYIEKIESLPGSLWGGMQINVAQAVLLIIAVAGFGYWLLEKQKAGAMAAVIGLAFFIGLRSSSFYKAYHQKKLIVYNIHRHQAIDIINGRDYFFIGDSDILSDDFTRNFHLTPSRVLHRIEPVDHLTNLMEQKSFMQYGSKKILLIDKNYEFGSSDAKIPIDILVISKNPRLYFSSLTRIFNIRRVVFDGSVPVRKLKYWKKDCDSLSIPYYDVNTKGAFVMNLN
jgi:competence protein ComEC